MASRTRAASAASCRRCSRSGRTTTCCARCARTRPTRSRWPASSAETIEALAATGRPLVLIDQGARAALGEHRQRDGRGARDAPPARHRPHADRVHRRLARALQHRAARDRLPARVLRGRAAVRSRVRSDDRCGRSRHRRSTRDGAAARRASARKPSSRTTTRPRSPRSASAPRAGCAFPTTSRSSASTTSRPPRIAPLTTLAVDKEALGRRGVELLLAEAPERTEISLPVELIVRASSQPAGSPALDTATVTESS